MGAIAWASRGSDFVSLRKSLPVFSHPESSYLCCPCECSGAYSLAITHSWGSSTTLARVSFLFFSITDVGLEYGFQTDCLNYQLLWVGTLLCIIHIKMTYILIHKCVSACSVCSVMSKSSPLYGLQPTGLLSAWDFPDENTGVVAISRPRDWTCLGLLHCMKILYPWATGKVTYISS